MYAVGEFEGQTVSYQILGKHEMHDGWGNYQVETLLFQMHNNLRIATLWKDSYQFFCHRKSTWIY